MKYLILSALMFSFLATGCVDCDLFCHFGDDPGSDAGVEINTGTGEAAQDCVYEEYFGSMVWRCNCDEQHHCIGCPGDVCIYTLTGNDAEIECDTDHQCQVLCNPYEEADCVFDLCEGDIGFCLDSGWQCNYWCPNTK